LYLAPTLTAKSLPSYGPVRKKTSVGAGKNKGYYPREMSGNGLESKKNDT